MQHISHSVYVPLLSSPYIHCSASLDHSSNSSNRSIMTMTAKILSKKLVKPATSTPDHLRTCNLSFLDQLAPPAHVPLIFFYKNFPIIIGKLEEHLPRALSEALTRFYPFAGRFVQDGFYVDCNDEGVKYIEAAHDDIDLCDFLTIATKDIPLVDDLVPWSNIGETALVTTPVVGIKVTKFKCGGLAIGSLVSHIVTDGFAAEMFFHDWAITTSALLANHEPGCYSEPAVFGIASNFPARDLSTVIRPMPMPSKFDLGKIVTKRFVFDEKAISALKANVTSSGDIIRPTRVEVVTSTIWKALINISASAESVLRNSTLYLHLNLRGRTGITGTGQPPISSTCTGNFYMEVPTKFQSSDTIMEGLKLAKLVSLLRNSLRTALTSCSKISNTENLSMEVAKNTNIVREDLKNKEVDVWRLSSLCRFPLYELDFGWGKPEWVTTGGIPAEIVFLLDTKCGTGIEAMVNLHEMEMVQFEQEVDISSFTS